MVCRAAILPAAWEDLKRIEDICSVQYGAAAALRAVDRILGALERLSLSCDAVSLTPDEWLNRQGYRMAVCGGYIAICRDAGGTRYVYHIADGKKEYPKLFS